LQECVDRYRDDDNSAFAQYANASPNITNPIDPIECGRAREYFGFEENFINDQQICDDIEQLASTRDFDILNEFFNQGGGQGSGGQNAGCVQNTDDGVCLFSPTLGTLWSVPLHLCCDFKLTP
jgi:hypothetical protein